MIRSLVGTLAVLLLALPEGGGAQAVSLVSPDGDVDWNRFYTAAETNQMLREFHALYPELTELYPVGESFRGQPLMLLEITNKATGPASRKPALYVDGGIHAAELTGSAVATYLIGYLLNGYGDDDRITALLDTRAFYVRTSLSSTISHCGAPHDLLMTTRTAPRTRIQARTWTVMAGSPGSGFPTTKVIGS